MASPELRSRVSCNSVGTSASHEQDQHEVGIATDPAAAARLDAQRRYAKLRDIASCARLEHRSATLGAPAVAPAEDLLVARSSIPTSYDALLEEAVVMAGFSESSTVQAWLVERLVALGWEHVRHSARSCRASSTA